MAASLAKRLGIQPGQDEHGIYQSACVEFADTHGWTRGAICYWWSQIAMARESCGQPRDVAEWMALRDVRLAFYELKQGTEPN